MDRRGVTLFALLAFKLVLGNNRLEGLDLLLFSTDAKSSLMTKKLKRSLIICSNVVLHVNEGQIEVGQVGVLVLSFVALVKAVAIVRSHLK